MKICDNARYATRSIEEINADRIKPLDVKLGLTGDKGHTDEDLTAEGKVTETTHVPAAKCKWNDIRGTEIPTNAVTPNATGGFFARLNYRTKTASNVTGFDLPTEVMFEIALRAGTTTSYHWNSAAYTGWENYCVGKTSNSGHPMEVGSKWPNFWGLYDLAGNIGELLRDDMSTENLSETSSPFIPAYSGETTRLRQFRSSAYSTTNPIDFASSRRSSGAYRDKAYAHIGFRVAIVVE